MPSLALRTSVLVHSCFPVAASSAKAARFVAPYRVPLTNVTPFGPSLGELYLCVQMTLPLVRLMA